MAAAGQLERFVPGRVLTRVEREYDQWTMVDGTLCFVDISGFTALSERLASKGRVGAEELTEVLSRVFGDMLDLVGMRGGTLLKFGGDALLLLFEGSDHAIQAASAAVEMRAALRRAADIPTSVGKVVLRMSVGLHSGAVHLFAVEGTHTELIVAGPTATLVNQMEGTADAGEIVVSAATRSLLPGGAATRPKGDGWLLSWRKPRVDQCGVVAFADETASSAEQYISTAVLEHLGGGASEPEHRLATVVFVKVIGVDDHISGFGPGSTSKELKELIAAVTRFADEEGVTFLATDVDAGAFKIILVSGVPATLVDEDGRALRVARQIADLATPFALKLGVNRGHVFSGEVGTAHRSTYTIMGDTVNLAARLMAAAPAGSIYVTPQVVSRSTTLYATKPVEPFHVKGKSRPVHALELGEEAGTRSARQTSTVPFVGREQPLAQLHAAIETLRSGRGDALAFSGPTGVGKSRIVDEGLAGAHITTIEARSEPYGTANPYRPFRDPVRALLGVERGPNEQMAASLVQSVERVAPDLLPLAPLLGDIAQVEVAPTPESRAIDVRFRQERAIDVLVEYLGAVLEGPTIIIAEDMHWADAATEALMNRLVREAHTHPWLVIQTCRAEITQDFVTTIVLDPLDDDEAAALVHAAAAAMPLRPHVVGAIVARAGGNPLFALELVSAAQDTGDIESLPTSLDGVVGSQIDSLEPLPRRVLRYLSVLGRSFRNSTARGLLKSQGIILDAATRERLKDFLEDDGPRRLQFRHAMIRDAAYDGLAYRKRGELHLKAADMVLAASGADSDSVADTLGLHFFLGGDMSRAWKFCRIAGDRNMAQYANPEAAVQFERALEAARRVPVVTDSEKLEVWVLLGDAQEQAGRFGPALDAYRRASRLAGDDPFAHAELLLKRAWVQERAGNYPAALRDATRSLTAVEFVNGQETQRLAARAIAFQALVHLRQGRLKDAERRARNASRGAEAAGEKPALARAYSVIAWTHLMADDPGALELCEQALGLYEEVGDLIGQNDMNNNLGVLAYFDGRWDDALTFYQRSRDGAERVGNIVDVGFAEANIGEVLVNQHRLDEAEARLQNAVRILRATGEASMATFAELQLARISIERDELDQAGAVLRDVIEESRANGYRMSAVEASLHLAECSIRRGDFGAALDQMDRTMAEAGDEAAMLVFTEARLRAQAMIHLGQDDEAVEILDQALLVARDREQIYDEALMLGLKADALAMDHPENAEVLRSESTSILTGLGVRSL